MLAIFAHLCEMFVGVMPSVNLFRHFYVLRSAGKVRGSSKIEAAGSCCFRLRDRAGEEYIPQETRNKWDDWRQQWCYLSVDPHAQLAMPDESAPTHKRRWEFLADDDDQLAPVLARIAELRAVGLTAKMVVVDFLRRWFALLRERGRPAWMYTGDRDIGRTHIGEDGNLSPEALVGLVKVLLGPVDAGGSRLPRRDLAPRALC